MLGIINKDNNKSTHCNIIFGGSYLFFAFPLNFGKGGDMF